MQLLGARSERREPEAPGEPDARETIERFEALFARGKNTFWRNEWWGVRTLQNPNDVWGTQEILSEVRPDFGVEAGTFRGGSAAIWAMVLDQVNPDGRVITIDIEDRADQARHLPIVQRKVDFLIGSSTAPEIVDEVKRRVE